MAATSGGPRRVKLWVDESRIRFATLPDGAKVVLLLIVYGLIGFGLVSLFGFEGTAGGFTGLDGVSTP